MDIYEYLLKNSAYEQGGKVAVAVSGGADSMALLTMACTHLGIQHVIALTFNHQLREESLEEAKFVANYCTKLGCQHEILSLSNDEQIKPNQNEARLMRYRHLLAYCTLNNISYLLTAHHRDDQIETYYIRLLQNSGLWGMAGISDYSKEGNIYILRPLLSEYSASLKKYLVRKNIKWIEDPSNKNPKYLRSQIRALLQNDKLQNIDNRHIQHYRNILTDVVNYWVQRYVKIEGAGYIYFPKKVFMQTALELQLHILRLCLQYIGRKSYFMSLNSIENIYRDIISSDLFSFGGCLIFSDNDNIYIQHEYRKKIRRDIFTFDNHLTILDNRFHIFHPQNRKIKLTYLGDFQNNYSEKLKYFLQKSMKKKYRYIKSLPIVIYGENKILYPKDNRENWADLECKVSVIGNSDVRYCQKYFIDPSF